MNSVTEETLPENWPTCDACGQPIHGESLDVYIFATVYDEHVERGVEGPVIEQEVLISVHDMGEHSEDEVHSVKIRANRIDVQEISL